MKQVVFLSLEYFKKHWKNVLWLLAGLYLAISAIGAYRLTSKLKQEAETWARLDVIYEGQIVKDNGKHGSTTYGIFKDANGEFVTKPIDIIEQHVLKPNGRYWVSFQRKTLNPDLDQEHTKAFLRLILYFSAFVVFAVVKISDYVLKD